MAIILKSNKRIESIPNFLLDTSDGLALNFSRGAYKYQGKEVSLSDVINVTVAEGSTVIDNFSRVTSVDANTPRISYNASSSFRGLLAEVSTPVNLLKEHHSGGTIPDTFKSTIDFGDSTSYLRNTFCVRMLGGGRIKVSIPDFNLVAYATQNSPVLVEPTISGSHEVFFEKDGYVDYVHMDDITGKYVSQIRKNLTDEVIAGDYISIAEPVVPIGNYTLVYEYYSPPILVRRSPEANLGVMYITAHTKYDLLMGRGVYKSFALLANTFVGVKFVGTTNLPLREDGLNRVAIKYEDGVVHYFHNGMYIGETPVTESEDPYRIRMGDIKISTFVPIGVLITQLTLVNQSVSSSTLLDITAF